MLKTNPAFVEVLVASMIDLLQRGKSVHIPGVGTWTVEHRTEAGAPQDRILFKPEGS